MKFSRSMMLALAPLLAVFAYRLGRIVSRLNRKTPPLSSAVEAAGREQLIASKAFLDSVVENIPNMIFVKDANELRFVRFNRAGEELVGHTQAELVGKNDYDFFPKDQADFFTAKDRAVLNGRLVVDIPEEPLSTKFGTRYLHTKKIPILDKSGSPLYLLGISEDITEKKFAEQQRMRLLQAEAARLEAEKTATRLAFLASASEALNETLDFTSMLNSFARVVIDNFADWCLIHLFDTADRSIGCVASMRKWPDRIGGLDRLPQTRRIDIDDTEGIGAVIRTGKEKIYREIDRDQVADFLKDRGLVDVILGMGLKSVIIVPLLYHGQVLGAITFLSTSERRVYGDFDLSIAQDLARRASFAIENARLFGKANEASRAKSAFLANISHEIRTPLGAMLGFADLALEDKSLSKLQEGYLSTIARNGRQLLAIVDEILDLSKAESDRIQIERLPFSLPDLLNEIETLFELKADEKGLTFAIHFDPHIPRFVSTDPLRLRQILINVIGNALKFTEHGRVDVFLNYRAEGEKNRIEFAVEDTGIGVSREQASHLFQPFVQADGSMTRRFGGTGLGLFLSRKLARLLDGDVKLAWSEPSRGSRFEISIPIEEVNDTSIMRPQTSPLDTREGVKAGIGKILVVDDSSDNRTLIGAFLKRLGIDAEFADNGANGVERSLHGRFALVFMDIQMPVMDGFEAIQTLRDRGYQGKVVALTAHAMVGDRERCLKSGFDDYLQKPITRQAFEACLAKQLTDTNENRFAQARHSSELV